MHASGGIGEVRGPHDDAAAPAVRQLRLVLTAEDYDAALAFYRDVVGLPARAAFASPGGRVTLFEAGQATLELADAPQADYIDRVEVGRRVAPKFRVAFEVPDARQGTARLLAGGAELIAAPTQTPWHSLNSRLEAPGGVQLTLFEGLPADEAGAAG